MLPADYILVVEDNLDLSEVEEEMLQAAGYHAESAHNGEEALRLVAERKPALILLDMLMPVMDGWQFAREYHQRYGHGAPIVVVTAAEHARARAAEVGAEGTLPKPFDMEELLRTVDRYRERTEEATTTPG